MSSSLRRRLAERWPLEPGDGLLVVFATMIGLVWAFVAFDLAITFALDLSVHIDGIGDVVRAIIFLPVFMFVLMAVALQWIGYAPDGWGIVLLFVASSVLPGVLIGLLGVVWLHRG